MLFSKNYKDPGLTEEQKRYENPILSRLGILDIMQRHGSRVPLDKWNLSYKDQEQQKALDFRIRAMVRDGQLILIEDTLYLPSYWPLKKGKLLSKKGEYFVEFEDTKEICPLLKMIPDLLFEGDIAWFAHLKELHQAAFHSLVKGVPVYVEGYLEKAQEYDLPEGYDGALYVKHGPFRGQVVSVKLPKNKRIKPKELIFARLIRDGESEYITAVIEDAAYPKGIRSIIKQYDLPWQPSQDVLQEAAVFNNKSIKAQPDRKDLRKLPFVTIDGETAKDFDDAVCAQIDETTGVVTLYVAVADVAHYVKPGSAIDKEAIKRGVSVYFPGYVIPMLPEVLSNELCSLMPHVDRYSLVCQMVIDSQGEISNYEFYPALICSHARLTYNQVQANQDIPENVQEPLKRLWDVYHLLHGARKRKGYVVFAQQGLGFDLLENERVKSVYRIDSIEAHHLIEEMMLAANRSAADFLKKNGPLGVYRVHEEPTDEKVQMLNQMVKPLGLSLAAPYTLDKIAVLSEQLQAKYPRLGSIVSRIMQRACYQLEPDAHYGLNFDLYSHFTSPIRRYPDLIVHRLIYGILGQKKIDTNTFVEALEAVNVLERRAEEAERSYHSYLKSRFAVLLSGQKLEATIMGMIEFGLFVELHNYPIDGMVHASQIDGSYWQFDAEKGLISSGSKTLKMGDVIVVELVSVDLQQCRVNFKVVGVKS